MKLTLEVPNIADGIPADVKAKAATGETYLKYAGSLDKIQNVKDKSGQSNSHDGYNRTIIIDNKKYCYCGKCQQSSEN